MLGKRYRNDGKATMPMGTVQRIEKKKVLQKIKNGFYKEEFVPCVICKESKFELLVEKERFGLPHKVQICTQCGLIQTNPRLTTDSYADFFDKHYRRLLYGYKVASEDYFRTQLLRGKTILKKIQKFVTKPENRLVLEVGCGSGGILQIFKENGYSIIGIDLDSEYVELGKAKGLNLKVGTIYDLSMTLKPDIIIYHHTLQHIHDPLQELKNIKKYCKPTTLIAITVPSVSTNFKVDFLKYLQFAHVYHFTEISLTNLIQNAGFEVIESTSRSMIIKPCEPKKIIKNDYQRMIKILHKSAKYHNDIIRRMQRAIYLVTTNGLAFLGLLAVVGKTYRKLSKVFKK